MQTRVRGMAGSKLLLLLLPTPFITLMATGLAPAPKLELSCGGDSPCSEDLPLHGNIAQATVSFPGVPAPWVKLDRCDDLDDNTIWMEYFPHWSPTASGPFNFQWLKGSNATSITVRASGWSARYNGTRLTDYSANTTAFFSFDYRETTTLLRVQDTGPGSVRLVGKAGKGLNETAAEMEHWADSCDFSAYAPDAPVDGALNFKPSFGLHQVDGGRRCAINLAFDEGGICYYAVQAARTGLAQADSSACVNWGQKCDHPLALVVPFMNGTVPSPPSGFVGAIHHVTPLKTPDQFCISGGLVSPSSTWTAFSGSQLKIPMCQVIDQEIPPRPRFASFLAPTWLTIVPKKNDTDPTYTFETLNSTKAVASGQGPSAGSNESRLRQTFDGGGRWEIYNDYVRCYLTFGQAHVGKTVQLYVLLHNNLAEVAAAEADPSMWQMISIELVAMPDLRPLLSWGKTKIMTALTWTDASLFFNGTTVDGSYSYLDTYARSPWNPPLPTWAHPPGALADEFSYPDNRTASRGWDGLQFGPEGPEFGRLYGMTKLPLNASLLPMWAPGVSDQATEMLKWERARNFSAVHNMVDMAYDGAFFRADVADFCQAVNSSRPQWIFTDDEGFPGSWAFTQYGALSQNAQARRVPGETDADLTWRMVSEFLLAWSDCLKDMPSSSGTRTMIGYYDTTFEVGQFLPAGFVPMPSEYGAMKNLRTFAASIRHFRDKMIYSPVPDELGPAGQLTELRQLLPVLTGCTYGQMDEVDVFEGTLHAFAGGASGFSFFAGNCFNDPGKVLALSTAAGLAAPFEDHFLSGQTISAPAQVTLGRGVLAAAGMRSGASCWLVVTPTYSATQSPAQIELDLRLPYGKATKLSACELISGQSYTFDIKSNGSVNITLRVAGTVVLHLNSSEEGDSNDSACAPTSLWVPRGRAGAVPS